jgi:DNA-binding SARP family transcriptional activator
MDDPDQTGTGCAPELRIRLLAGFGVTVDGQRLELPFSAERVIAALALRPVDHDRTRLGATLYPDARRSRISANLRSALWRARRDAGPALVDTRGQRLRIGDRVDVDLRHWSERARQLTSGTPGPEPVGADDVEAFAQELLPGWSEDWLQLDQRRWDQLRLHALERLADVFAAAGRFVEALEAGLAAVAIEPFRESAHRALITAFIAEGNRASAVEQYHRYHRLVTHELGLRPTAQMQALVQGLIADHAR